MAPFLDFFGLPIGSYGLMMALAFLCVGGLGCLRAARRGLVVYDVLITGAMAVGFGLVGAQLLFFAVTYTPDTLRKLVTGDESNAIAGGQVFYGGLLAGILGGMLGAKLAKVRLADMERVLIPMLPLGHALGRIGCVLAGCCHGMAYDGFLALRYPNSVLGLPPEQGYFPVQILEAVANVGISGVLLLLDQKTRREWDLTLWYLLLYGIVRFGTEFLRGDELRGIWFGISTSAWISLGLVLLCGSLLVLRRNKNCASVAVLEENE